eukprot:TRINITY_DN954_c0_g1_i4.p1 TRINITY_DN954_c0_g1~~TRINITY_DN954_c0_g1_i4.p1  ORF type:complete len:201 (-),score=36.99 TRINITY_DN954_c0_g1_i4:165-767(-)
MGDHGRMESTYFSRFPGYYMTGDGARRDADGHLWLTGRTDDVLNVSGHRLGTAEVESAIVGVPDVAEAAVVGIPHEVTGEALYAFVVLMPGVEGNDGLRAAITAELRARIGPIARVETLHWVGGRGLPKTRSGKILRRLLRLIATGGGRGPGRREHACRPECVGRAPWPAGRVGHNRLTRLGLVLNWSSCVVCRPLNVLK